MENEMKEEQKQDEQAGYTPRPAREVWLARLGLVIMIAFVIYQLLAISRGGL